MKRSSEKRIKKSIIMNNEAERARRESKQRNEFKMLRGRSNLWDREIRNQPNNERVGKIASPLSQGQPVTCSHHRLTGAGRGFTSSRRRCHPGFVKGLHFTDSRRYLIFSQTQFSHIVGPDMSGYPEYNIDISRQFTAELWSAWITAGDNKNYEAWITAGVDQSKISEKTQEAVANRPDNLYVMPPSKKR
jgi:hypothetical protein